MQAVIHLETVDVKESDSIITIAIPFHRGLGYLAEAIDSVLNQSDPRWRLLVSDDSGEGAAEALVRRYADERFSYEPNPENLGMVRNWNRCLDLSPSPLVTLFHADDRLGPDYVRIMHDAAARHPEAVAYFCKVSIIDSASKPRFSFRELVRGFFVPRQDPAGDLVLAGAGAVESLMAGNFIPCPALCWRIAALRGKRFSDSWDQAQDIEFTTRLLMAGERLVGVRRWAYEYRRHAASATERQTESLLRYEEELRLFDLVAERAEKLGWDGVARVSRRKRIVRLHLLYRVLADAASFRPVSALQKLRFLFRKT